MSKEKYYRSEKDAMEEARRMEEVTGYPHDVFYNSDTWEVFQEENPIIL